MILSAIDSSFLNSQSLSSKLNYPSIVNSPRLTIASERDTLSRPPPQKKILHDVNQQQARPGPSPDEYVPTLE